MTDKEIIIDGVDVSKCGHINTCDNKINCVILQDDVCETNPYCEGYNCYYKQLKRKEKECEKYKQTLTEIKDYCNKYPQNSIGFKKYILQKISECEEEK